MKLAALLLALVPQERVPLQFLGSAQWELDAARVEVGEPFEATLVVRHQPAEQVELAPSAFDADLSWLLLDVPRLEPDSDPASTRWSMKIASLEPGQRDLPALALVIVDARGRRQEIGADPMPIEVSGVLAGDEDRPRAPLDFRPPGADAGASGRVLAFLIAGALVLCFAAVALWLWLRRRATPVVVVPSVRERVEALGQRDLQSPAVVRELYYELTALLRAEIDARQALARAALTDREWLEQAKAALPAHSAVELGEILDAGEAIKYGAEHPTHWAVRETLDRAVRVLQAAGNPAQVAA